MKTLFKYIRAFRIEINFHIVKVFPKSETVKVEVLLPPLGTRERVEISSNKRDEWRRIHKEAAVAYQEALAKAVYRDMYISNERQVEKDAERVGRGIIN